MSSVSWAAVFQLKLGGRCTVTGTLLSSRPIPTQNRKGEGRESYEGPEDAEDDGELAGIVVYDQRVVGRLREVHNGHCIR